MKIIDQGGMDIQRPFPGFKQALGLLALALLMQMAIGSFMIVAGATELTASHLALANILSFGAIIFLGWKRTGEPFLQVFPMQAVSSLLLVPFVLTLAGASILLSELDNLLRLVLPPPDWFTENIERVLGDPDQRGAAIFALIIVAPLTEEFLFRGLILSGFLQRYGVSKAILWTALLFGAFHLNPWQFGGAFVLGLLFGWLMVRTSSLFLPIFGHAFVNSLPLLLRNLGIEIRGYTSSPGAIVQFQPLWFDTLGIALVIAGLALFRVLLRRLEHTAGWPSG